MPAGHSEFLSEIRVGIQKVVKKGKKAVAKQQRQAQRKTMTKINIQQKKAEADLAKAQAELAVRQTQLKAYQTRQQAEKTRKAAGQFTVSERVAGTMKAVGDSGANFVRGFIQDGRKRRPAASRR